MGKMRSSIDECVSRASQSLTLKTGDIVAMPMPADVTVRMGNNVRVSLDRNDELNFMIK